MAQEKIRCENCGRLVRYEAKAVKNGEVSCPVCQSSTMVQARAVARFVRTAPRKLRLVADSIRGKNVQEALLLLRLMPKRAARVISKVVESARANAENTYQMVSDNLVVSNITVDGGPILKRFMPRAMGRAAMIQKRTSHITVKLKETAKKSK